MKKGDLCKVIKHEHTTDSQLGDLILILKPLNPHGLTPVYVEGYNLIQQRRHHYRVDALEIVKPTDKKCPKST
jgi:hypothetical protein